MSGDRSPLFHGWRARTHFLTRDRAFLLRCAGWIIAAGLSIAFLIVLGAPQENAAPQLAVVAPGLSRLQEGFTRLRAESSPQPRRLAIWLRLLLARLPQLLEEEGAGGAGAEAYRGYVRTGSLGGYEVARLIRMHATSDAPAGLFEEYLAAALGADLQAFRHLEQRARSTPPEMLSSELYGSVCKRRQDMTAAMQAFYKEGLHFEDAAAAREEALRLAVAQHSLPVLRAIAAQPGWIEQSPPLLQHHAGTLLGDVWMQWRGLLRHRLAEMPLGVLALAFFSAALWYFILVQHSCHERWRWARPVAALAAGVASVWPTVTLLSYQEFEQGLTSEAPFPYDLVYYVCGVGLREEGCKLLLFTFFLPWLLWRRTPGLALLTGAFVGLGFSLAENIDYYQDYGGTVAWTRFISANFLHISLTGICAHSFYRMLLTRFARAGEFIETFLLAVLAHGGYDYLSAMEDGGTRWFSVVVLILSAARFMDLLAEETCPARLTIAPLAVFTLGSAVLIALSFILGARAAGSFEGIAAAGQECLSVVPVALLYWRKFENV